MANHTISVSAIIPANPQKVYSVIADYRNGHPRILPKPHFIFLHVREGGYGAGTVIEFQTKVMGQVQSFHSIITEPAPGRILVETDQSSGIKTTFSVEPYQNGAVCHVIIATTMEIPNGLIGKIQGWLISTALRPIYIKELKLLADVTTEK